MKECLQISTSHNYCNFNDKLKIKSKKRIIENKRRHWLSTKLLLVSVQSFIPNFDTCDSFRKQQKVGIIALLKEPSASISKTHYQRGQWVHLIEMSPGKPTRPERARGWSFTYLMFAQMWSLTWQGWITGPRRCRCSIMRLVSTGSSWGGKQWEVDCRKHHDSVILGCCELFEPALMLRSLSRQLAEVKRPQMLFSPKLAETHRGFNRIVLVNMSLWVTRISLSMNGGMEKRKKHCYYCN